MKQLPLVDSLEEFLVELGTNLAERYPRVTDLFNWIMLQFGTLPDEEKQIVQNQIIDIHYAVKDRLGQFAVDEQTAERLAWLISFSFRGYQQVFVKMEVGQVVDLDAISYGRFLAKVVGHAV